MGVLGGTWVPGNIDTRKQRDTGTISTEKYRYWGT